MGGTRLEPPVVLFLFVSLCNHFTHFFQNRVPSAFFPTGCLQEPLADRGSSRAHGPAGNFAGDPAPLLHPLRGSESNLSNSTFWTLNSFPYQKWRAWVNHVLRWGIHPEREPWHGLNLSSMQSAGIFVDLVSPRANHSRRLSSL